MPLTIATWEMLILTTMLTTALQTVRSIGGMCLVTYYKLCIPDVARIAVLSVEAAQAIGNGEGGVWHSKFIGTYCRARMPAELTSLLSMILVFHQVRSVGCIRHSQSVKTIACMHITSNLGSPVCVGLHKTDAWSLHQTRV